MKRFACLLPALLLAALTSNAFADARGVAPKLVLRQLQWQQYGADGGVTGSAADTTYLSGATQDVDTTAVFDAGAVAFPGPTNSGASTGQGILSLIVWGSSATTFVSTDSLFVGVDVSPDGKAWTAGTIYGRIGAPATIAGAVVVPILLDGDASDAGQWLLAPYLRFRVRTDGNTAARMSGLKVGVAFRRWDNN